MKERKLNINQPQLSADDISGYKDFNSLQQRYESSNRFSYIKWGAAGLSAAAVALVIIFTVLRDPNTEKTIARAFISPPLTEVNIAYSDYAVNADNGGELTYQTGSLIRIPKNAFLDKHGNVVTGDVTVKYREFHDPADFFLSGIPMTYDSAGVTYQFESAGMMEMMAYKEGEPLAVNPSSKIQIELASRDSGNQFNLYFLDTVAKRWVNKGKDSIVQPEPEPIVVDAGLAVDKAMVMPVEDIEPKLRQLSNELHRIEKDIQAMKKPNLIKPQKANNERYVFDFDVEEKDFPDIALFDGMYFEMGPENTNFNPSLYKYTWEDAEIKENVKGTNYLLTLKKGGETHQFIVYPVYKGENFNTAMKMYDKKYKDYEEMVAERKKEELRKKQEYEAKLKKAKRTQEEQEAKMKEWREQQLKAQQAMVVQFHQADNSVSYWNIRRVFQIDGFGIYNTDSPFKYQKSQQVIAGFRDKSGKELNVDIAYHIDRSKNTIFAHYINNNSGYSFTYNPSSENILFVVLPDQKLGIFNEDAFRKVEVKTNERYMFELNIAEKKFETVQEVKKYLDQESKS